MGVTHTLIRLTPILCNCKNTPTHPITHTAKFQNTHVSNMPNHVLCEFYIK